MKRRRGPAGPGTAPSSPGRTSPEVQSSPIIRPRPARCSRVSTLRSNSRIGCAAPGRQDRAAQRDDAVDEVGAPAGQAAGHQAAEAVPDDGDLAAALGGDRLDAPLERLGGLRVQPTLACIVER